MKKVKSLEGTRLLIKGVSKTVENGVNEQKRRFLGMFRATLSDRLLENMLTGGGIVTYRQGNE